MRKIPQQMKAIPEPDQSRLTAVSQKRSKTMLIIAGLLCLYVDILMGGVDFVPDLLGYFLIFMGLFREWRFQKESPAPAQRLLILCILTAALHVLSGGERASYLTTIILMMAEGVGQYFLVRGLYQMAQKQNPESVRPDRAAIVKTALILILLCQACGPILSLVPAMPYVLLGIQLLTGLYVTVQLWQIMKKPV